MDMIKADKYMNSLFENIIPHFERMKMEAQAALAAAAIQYAESDDPAHRKIYLDVKSRVDTIHNICQVILEDAGVGIVVRNKICVLFPDLVVMQPVPPAPAPVPPADQVVLVDDNKDGKSGSDSSAPGQSVQK